MVQSSDYTGQHWEIGQSISYTFNVSSIGGYEFSSYYQSTFETAMSQWSSVANITFEETSDPWTADWLIGWDPYPDGYGGTLGWSASYDFDGDGVMESSQGDYSIIAMDVYDTSYFYSTAIHEAGHALGIAHIDHTSSIMATYENGLQALTSYDIEVIQDLYGAPGSSTTDIIGTEGNDTLIGSDGNDVMSGAGGQDTLVGWDGDDLIYGNKGEDILFGIDGHDTLYGGQNGGNPSGNPAALRDGIDTLYGAGGNDLLYGNHGGDYLDGGPGADTIYGGQDSDTIYGGSENDVLFGNLGSDIFLTNYISDGGQDRIYGFEIGVDFIDKTNDSAPTYGYVDDAFLVDFSRYGSFLLVGVNPEDPSALFL
jgi:Ca2+-binding RTX toxin-like protein